MAQPLLPAEVPAIVIGAGPTGLILAGLLGRMGVEALPVGRNAATSDIPKALGLAEEIRARTQYRDGDGNLIAESGTGLRAFGYCKRNFIS